VKESERKQSTDTENKVVKTRPKKFTLYFSCKGMKKYMKK